MKKLLLSIFLLFGSLLMGDNPRAMIIFDASGSMWGQINGKSKVEIARDALNKVVRTWNPNVELGLTVYGHRTKGDCNDIQTVIPVGRVQSYRMISTVNAIKPKGKTPISRSIRKAADALRYTEEKATIILISDGKETCDPDPCATAKALKAEGIDLVTHVIGFNVDRKTDAELECIANATGGEYFSAKNANALNEAMKTIVKKVEKVEAPKPKPVVKKLTHTVEISASETKGGKWIESYHKIYNTETEDRVTSCTSRKKKPCSKQIPVGKYIVKSTYNDFKQEQSFEVKAGEVTKVHLVMGQTGEVTLTAAETEGGKWVESYHKIYNTETEDRVTSCTSRKKEACTKQIPVGKYIVKSSYNKFKQEQVFEVKSGEKTNVHIIFGQTGKVEVSGSETEGSKWVNLYGYIYPADENGKKDGSNVGQVNRTQKEPSIHQLPAGKYMMELEYNRFKKKVLFEIKSGETTKIHLIMGQTGKVEVSASKKEGGKWINLYGYIYPADENGEKDGGNVGQVNNRSAKDLSVHQLPVGKYMMEVEHNDFTKKVVFDVTAGKTNRVHVIFSPFTIGTKCANMNAKVSYEIYAGSGQLVYEKKRQCSDTLKVTLDNGDYSVEAKVGDTIKTVKFTVDGTESKLHIDMRE